MIALLDCNNFYASCERVFRPDLANKPVVVLSNNDGCIISRSDEAKAAGIPMGAPAFKLREVFERHDVAVFSANFALYGDLSMRVMSILSEYCPDVEVSSIDEAFLDFRGFDRFDLQQYGEEIARRIRRCTGIPVSLGFGPGKALAKCANSIAKKYPGKTNGVYIIDSEEKRIKALKWLPISDVWGIGRRLGKRLKAINVNTAYEFTQLADEYIRKSMSVVELRLKKDLEGEQTLPFEKTKSAKNIAITRSFEKLYTTLEELSERVATFSTVCSEKLRRQRSLCRSIMVFVHTDRFRHDQPQYSRNIILRLPFATSSGIEITGFALEGLKQIYKEGYLYKKAGVIVMDFIPDDNVQQSLFLQSDPRHVRLMQAIDSIHASAGQQKVKLAIQDMDRTWKMKQERLSPRYTTRLSEIITVYAR